MVSWFGLMEISSVKEIKPSKNAVLFFFLNPVFRYFT